MHGRPILILNEAERMFSTGGRRNLFVTLLPRLVTERLVSGRRVMHVNPECPDGIL
jgi:hypothetical protein